MTVGGAVEETSGGYWCPAGEDPALICRSLWIVWADLRDIQNNPYTFTRVDEHGTAREYFVGL